MQQILPRATYNIRAKLWRYGGIASWHFLTLPRKHASAIRTLFAKGAPAFGSIAVLVTVGQTQWRTSLFPDKKTDSYLIPVKAAIRKAEGLEPDQMVTATIHVL